MQTSHEFVIGRAGADQFDTMHWENSDRSSGTAVLTSLGPREAFSPSSQRSVDTAIDEDKMTDDDVIDGDSIPTIILPAKREIPSSLPLRAAMIWEMVRNDPCIAGPAGGKFCDATNFDSCVRFLELAKVCKEWKGIVDRKSKISPGYHGTSPRRVSYIVDQSLLVPDGKKLRVKNENNFGTGIYVSAEPELAFVCMIV